MDAVNKRFGGRTLYYADAMEAQRSREAAPMRIAFNHIPELELERDQNVDKKASDPSRPEAFVKVDARYFATGSSDT